MTTGKHKLSRDDPWHWEYLRDTSFVELQWTAEELITVSSNEDSNPSDTHGSKTVIDENGQTTGNESSFDLSTEEEKKKKCSKHYENKSLTMQRLL